MKLRDWLRLAIQAMKGQLRGGDFWTGTKGVVHIGGHRGQERTFYFSKRLPVLWIEGDPEKAEQLTTNLQGFPRQRIIEALLSDEDGKPVSFHVSSNDGASSSILEFAGHAKMWPEVTMTKTLDLTSRRFDSLVDDLQIDLSGLDTLVLDVQGAELMVLRGMGATLDGFSKLEIEAADFEAYKGGTTVDELLAFCKSAGFQELERIALRHTEGIGTYYDIRFAKTAGSS